MEHVSVEIWQQILLKAMEANDWPIFGTSCTPYTFLAFMHLYDFHQRDRKPYQDYLTQRRGLRLVCRAWNKFVLFTSHRWLLLEEALSPMYKVDPTTSYAEGGVGPVEKLSTVINSNELGTPILSWVSHILKRPASQTPLRTYILWISGALRQGYNPLDDLIGTTTTQNPGCSNTNTNTNTTLRALSIAITSPTRNFISLSQISRTFTGLRMLSLFNINATPQQTLTLAHLEVLYVRLPSKTLLESMGTWDVPALRHVSLGNFSMMSLTDVVDRFLGRWAHQIESLFCKEFDRFRWSILASPLLDLPSGFWAQFPVLRLLGLDPEPLQLEEWSGWSVVPPPTHPCRYLVCCLYSVEEIGVEDIRTNWTWHDGVRLVAGDAQSNQYYVVKNIRDDPSFANMEKTVGVLPEL